LPTAGRELERAGFLEEFDRGAEPRDEDQNDRNEQCGHYPKTVHQMSNYYRIDRPVNENLSTLTSVPRVLPGLCPH
jgi:hypothetical protein